jgi:hypothetical protein
MKRIAFISALFGLSAIYDGVLGMSVLLKPYYLFEFFEVVPPNHPGYVQFPAAILIIFALMFTAIAINPSANRNLIPYGVLLKFSYAGVVFFYWITQDLPNMWKPFAIADTVFMVLFIWAYLVLQKSTAQT